MHLKILDLTNNNFTGSVPPQLSKLSVLQVLYTRTNQLSGTIAPALFVNMSQLRYLLMYENRISGTSAAPPRRTHAAAPPTPAEPARPCPIVRLASRCATSVLLSTPLPRAQSRRRLGCSTS